MKHLRDEEASRAEVIAQIQHNIQQPFNTGFPIG
jgi:hypothetical protein